MKEKTKRKKIEKEVPLPLSKENYRLLGIGIGVIILGYIFLAQGPADSFWSRTLAPVILVIGYCVILPLSLLYRGKKMGG